MEYALLAATLATLAAAQTHTAHASPASAFAASTALAVTTARYDLQVPRVLFWGSLPLAVPA